MAAGKAAADAAGRILKNPQGLFGGGGALLAAAGVAYGAYNSVYTVDGGHRAIMFNRLSGIQSDIAREGLHFRVPWFQYPIVYDIRARPNQLRSPTGSKDLQVGVLYVSGLWYMCRW